MFWRQKFSTRTRLASVLIVLSVLGFTLPVQAQEKSQAPTSQVWLISPVPDARVDCGSPFGGANPAGGQAFHNAVDICGGSDDVIAVSDCELVWNRWWPPAKEANGTGHGITAICKHSMVDGQTIYSYAAHLDWVNPEYPVGSIVPQGGILGHQGTTGYMQIKNKHVHWGLSPNPPEITDCWNASCWFDPMEYLGKAFSLSLTASENLSVVPVAKPTYSPSQPVFTIPIDTDVEIETTVEIAPSPTPSLWAEWDSSACIPNADGQTCEVTFVSGWTAWQELWDTRSGEIIFWMMVIATVAAILLLMVSTIRKLFHQGGERSKE